MTLKRHRLLLGCLLICFAGCSSNNSNPQTNSVQTNSQSSQTSAIQPTAANANGAGAVASVSPSPAEQQATGGIDACSLITTQEVADVQGGAVKETKSSQRNDGDFLMSQCFYTAEEFVRSVSLSVVQPDPASPTKQPKEYFTEKFRGAGKESKSEREKEREREKEHERAKEQKGKGEAQAERGRGEEEEEEGANVEPISGLGDGAYWVKSGPSASLYVLKKDQFLILSIGGGDAEPIKLKKTKALAQLALKRMK